MYNPYQAPGQYGQYGAASTVAPGMALPPGMTAPGTGAIPGFVPQQQQQQHDGYSSGRPGAFPPNFQPPANMPNINFSAPVIRLGTGPAKGDNLGSAGGLSGRDERGDRTGAGRRGGLGSGMGADSRGEKERIAPIQPQTKEEIIKTIFVGGLTESVGTDEEIERILRAAGNLRKWFRAMDADDKPCKFGFAEYEDPESLGTAIEVLKDVKIPINRRKMEDAKADKDIEEGDEKETETVQLLVVADENSLTYIEQWEESHGGANEDHKQMLLDQAREALQAVLADLENPSAAVRDELSGYDRDGDATMGDGQKEGDVVTIPLSVDEELSDIPAEMRETVAREITAFRDRSNRRDLERLKREEEVEQQERNRMSNGNRQNRLASPPPTAPSGPGGANGIPVGPRGSGMNVPSGPKALGTGFPKDYAKGVTFVNGTGISASAAFDDEDTDASDEELEQRRKAKKDAELEKQFLDQERRWLNRERSRTAAVEREKNRDQDESSRLDEEKEAMARRLREWDDDAEASRKVEEYYADRSMWIRNRASFRQRESALDESDRLAEQRERARDFQQRERAGAMADDFLARQEDELVMPKQDREAAIISSSTSSTRPAVEPARFKLALGAAAQKQAQANLATQQGLSKRTVADVEFLLEDEEDSATESKRKIVPIQFDKNDVVRMSDEERAEASKNLAAEIPTDKDGLWNWDVKWDCVDDGIIEDRLKPFVEKKIVEYLGVQEQMLVDVVVGALKNKATPADLVRELEGALDEEADVLVRKLWRMVIFFSESEKRGLSA